MFELTLLDFHSRFSQSFPNLMFDFILTFTENAEFELTLLENLSDFHSKGKALAKNGMCFVEKK